MAPLLPRMQVFEIADFSWFPGFLRGYFQAALSAAWTNHIPLLQRASPAELVASLLAAHLRPPLHEYTVVDFCAGAGGPTPAVERHLNSNNKSSSASSRPVRFVLTDLHPHPRLWARAAARSPNLEYVPYPVDATNAPAELLSGGGGGGGGGGSGGGGGKVFRMFNLSFHHFDDGLARRVIRDVVDRGDEGFGIFELQDRGIAGFLSCCLFCIATLIMAPYYALLWGEPLALFFTYVVPILPVVLLFDGWMSCLRTRTPDEVEALLRTCGAAGGDDEIDRWEVRSGSELFMWPVGKLHWIICIKK